MAWLRSLRASGAECPQLPTGEAQRGPLVPPPSVPLPPPQVNGVCVEGKQHGDVVSAIKAGGDEAKLLVVDRETDEFFKKCKVIPSQEHLSGELHGAPGSPPGCWPAL